MRAVAQHGCHKSSMQCMSSDNDRYPGRADAALCANAMQDKTKPGRHCSAAPGKARQGKGASAQ